LLGIVFPDGRVAFASDRIILGEEFVQAAQQGRSPESRFRFGGTCVREGCRQWTGERCGVIDTVIDSIGDSVPKEGLPDCSIRPQCRWYLQSGASACTVCPYVQTDSRSLQVGPEGGGT